MEAVFCGLLSASALPLSSLLYWKTRSLIDVTGVEFNIIPKVGESTKKVVVYIDKSIWGSDRTCPLSFNAPPPLSHSSLLPELYYSVTGVEGTATVVGEIRAFGYRRKHPALSFPTSPPSKRPPLLAEVYEVYSVTGIESEVNPGVGEGIPRM